MSRVKCWQVDAFTNRPFQGNPAAVCWLEHHVSDGWMQSVAAEMNLSETAFVSRRDDGYGLRWFTPAMEVDLCGHATLASAHVLFAEGFQPQDEPVGFHTRSGVLTCQRNNGLIEMDFPATPARVIRPPDGLLESLGVLAIFLGRTEYDYLVIVESAETVRSLTPDFSRLKSIKTRGVIVSSQSDDPQYDFISRFFAPAAGIDEDPVTGSAHCCLGPYWAEILGKRELRALQASQRAGDLRVSVRFPRVALGGEAVTVLQGELSCL